MSEVRALVALLRLLRAQGASPALGMRVVSLMLEARQLEGDGLPSGGHSTGRTARLLQGHLERCWSRSDQDERRRP
ncbi:MAG: hypothetical protein VKP57_07960 [Candidatus Sericytochromatia bacterium]|nr:hypothetical protein [Candidatus Sericytochromatia bacterium]